MPVVELVQVEQVFAVRIELRALDADGLLERPALPAIARVPPHPQGGAILEAHLDGLGNLGRTEPSRHHHAPERKGAGLAGPRLRMLLRERLATRPDLLVDRLLVELRALAVADDEPRLRQDLRRFNLLDAVVDRAGVVDLLVEPLVDHLLAARNILEDCAQIRRARVPETPSAVPLRHPPRQDRPARPAYGGR